MIARCRRGRRGRTGGRAGVSRCSVDGNHSSNLLPFCCHDFDKLLTQRPRAASFSPSLSISACNHNRLYFSDFRFFLSIDRFHVAAAAVIAYRPVQSVCRHRRCGAHQNSHVTRCVGQQDGHARTHTSSPGSPLLSTRSTWRGRPMQSGYVRWTSS